MPERRSVSWFVWMAVLYVAASPILVLRAIGALFVWSRRTQIVQSGFLRCPYCRHGNRLDVLVTCPSCHFAEYRSLALPCSECGHRIPWISCACGASLRIE